jgi:hypothetical protein
MPDEIKRVQQTVILEWFIDTLPHNNLVQADIALAAD